MRESSAFIALYPNTPSLKGFAYLISFSLNFLHFLLVIQALMEKPLRRTIGLRACMSSMRSDPYTGRPWANLNCKSPKCLQPGIYFLASSICVATCHVSSLFQFPPRQRFLDLHDLQEGIGPVEPVSWSGNWVEQCFAAVMGIFVCDTCAEVYMQKYFYSLQKLVRILQTCAFILHCVLTWPCNRKRS